MCLISSVFPIPASMLDRTSLPIAANDDLLVERARHGEADALSPPSKVLFSWVGEFKAKSSLADPVLVDAVSSRCECARCNARNHPSCPRHSIWQLMVLRLLPRPLGDPARLSGFRMRQLKPRQQLWLIASRVKYWIWSEVYSLRCDVNGERCLQKHRGRIETRS
jgi:hypothetical protein